MKLNELSEKTKTTYKVVDLVKDKYNATFSGMHQAMQHLEWCLQNGATQLRLVTTESTITIEEVLEGDEVD